jgi:hypothetical protein
MSQALLFYENKKLGRNPRSDRDLAKREIKVKKRNKSLKKKLKGVEVNKSPKKK